MRNFFIPILLSVLCSCSVTSNKRDVSSAGPDCYYTFHNLIANKYDPKNIVELEQKYANEMNLVRENRDFYKTIYSDGLKRNQRKSALILAMLKKVYPMKENHEIIESYWKAFTHCK